MAIRTNARPGTCASCGKSVATGAGFSFLHPDSGWSVCCDDAGCRHMCGVSPKVEPEVVPAPRQSAREILKSKEKEVFRLALVAVKEDNRAAAMLACSLLKEFYDAGWYLNEVPF